MSKEARRYILFYLCIEDLIKMQMFDLEMVNHELEKRTCVTLGYTQSSFDYQALEGISDVLSGRLALITLDTPHDMYHA
jgi:hypothetical protein